MNMMKALITRSALFAFMAILSIVSAGSAEASVAVAQNVQGEVLVSRAASPDTWEAVTQDTALENGDSLKTNNGSCSLVYTDQATFAVEPNTTLTVEDKETSKDIRLLLGKIKGKVDKQKVEQPFMINTPAAVATVRGTQVDFSFDEKGQLLVDLHTGKIEVVNETAEMKFDLEGVKSISLVYDKEANVIRFKNECGSDGPVTFNVLGASYSEAPCSEREVALSTAEQGVQPPPVIQNTTETTENPNEGREPISPTES